jgi:sulfur-oxidizing protein SoxY
MMGKILTTSLSRRDVMGFTRIGAIALAGLGFVRGRTATAAQTVPGASGTPEDLGALLDMGRITLTLPPVHNDGSSVPLEVEVVSAMSESDYVSHIDVVAPGNPIPEVARFSFSPLSGRASVETRIRLDAGTQTVVATATLSDGSTLTAEAEVQITIGGCST